MGGYFDLTAKKEKILELQTKSEDSNFWNNREEAEDLIRQLNDLKGQVNRVERVEEKIKANLEVLSLLELENDESLQKEVEEETEQLNKELEELNLLLMLNGPYDKNNCILEIHPGAGGTESCDWASMLYRMYLRWCEKKNYKVTLLDYQDGDEAGIKSVSIMIKGLNAYGYLKCERGVHRLVRISPFDSNKRRHTSFASVEVTPEVDDNINIEIKEEDIRVDVYRSTGAGGQGVNTTDSAVRITHIPTNIVVTCQNERSQLKNKELAMKVLKAKLIALEEEKQRQEKEKQLGTQSDINFGSQIRSYVMHPYSMVKDHRTNYEKSDVDKVMDGYIDEFIEEYLRKGVE